MPINLATVPYAIPPLVSAIFVLPLGIFVYMKNRQSTTHIYFALLMLVCAIWLGGFAAMNVMQNESDAFIFSRILYTAVIMIPTFYYGFMSNFLNLKNKKMWLTYSYICSAFFIYCLWATSSFLSGNIRYHWGFSSKANWMHGIYLVFFFSIFIASFYQMYRAYKAVKDKDLVAANKIKYTLFAFIMASIASADFLSTYGIDYYPPGFMFMITFAIITTYAIVKHKLLDINIVLRKSAVYSISLASISLILMIFLLIGEKISQVYFGYSSMFFTFLTVMIISILFLPLHNFLARHLSKWLLSALPEELAEQNRKFLEKMQSQDKLKAVATLASGMAHEIKNPLTSIKTFVEFLPEKYDDPEFRDKFKRIVVDEVDRVNNIVQQLLDFGKPLGLEFKTIPLTGVLDETLTLLNHNLVKSGIRIIKDYQAHPLISADKNQLKQAFLNIFLNSIQAMPHGGILSVSISSEKGNHTVAISDTGCGISENHLKQVFDPFFTTKETGTGLGLSIVHGIIKEHGGRIEVRSEAGRGTTVSVVLRNQS